MQAERFPPGQFPDGDGGVGPGLFPLKVVPISPTLMLLNLTPEFGEFFSTSSGFPEVVAQDPLGPPGEVLSVG
jgi:hypothetical protein